MKKNIRKIAVIATAALVFTACASNNENIESLDENEKNSTTTTTSYDLKPVTTTTSNEVEITTTITTKPEETSITSEVEEVTTTTEITTTTTPASTTATTPVITTTAVTTPAPQVTTAPVTTTTTTKPVETTPVHDCNRDGHKWEVTYITSEPKWCEEIHNVYDYGFDVELASRYLGVDGGTAYQIYLDTCDSKGVIGNSGSATVKVEVWGTETYEYAECSVCHAKIQTNSYPISINPLGEWQFKDGISTRWQNSDYRDYFNLLFYDPYNIPQSVLDNIDAFFWGSMGW